MLNFEELWNAHPSVQEEKSPCSTDGSANFTNQCAIRMGTALKECGVRRSQLSAPTLCWFHPKSDLHVLRAEELAKALSESSISGLGSTEVVSNPGDFQSELEGKTGIIFFKDYWFRNSDPAESPTGDHIDVWNGKDTGATSAMHWATARTVLAGYSEAKEIIFWNVW